MSTADLPAKTAVEGQRTAVKTAGIKVRHRVVAKTAASDPLIRNWPDKFHSSKLEIHANRPEASVRLSVIISQAAPADAK